MTKRCLLAALPALFAVSASAQEETNWSISTQHDEANDRENGSATLTSSDGDELVFACNGANDLLLSLQYLPKRSLGTEAKIVLVKFDREEPRLSLWGYTPEGAFTIAPAWVDFFSNQVGDAERSIFVRAMNKENQPVDSVFISRGGRTAINRVREICGEPAI